MYMHIRICTHLARSDVSNVRFTYDQIYLHIDTNTHTNARGRVDLSNHGHIIHEVF